MQKMKIFNVVDTWAGWHLSESLFSLIFFLFLLSSLVSLSLCLSLYQITTCWFHNVGIYTFSLTNSPVLFILQVHNHIVRVLSAHGFNASHFVRSWKINPYQFLAGLRLLHPDFCFTRTSGLFLWRTFQYLITTQSIQSIQFFHFNSNIPSIPPLTLSHKPIAWTSVSQLLPLLLRILPSPCLCSSFSILSPAIPSIHGRQDDTYAAAGYTNHKGKGRVFGFECICGDDATEVAKPYLPSTANCPAAVATKVHGVPAYFHWGLSTWVYPCSLVIHTRHQACHSRNGQKQGAILSIGVPFHVEHRVVSRNGNYAANQNYQESMPDLVWNIGHN